MQSPRVRFTMRRMMIGVAAVGVLFWAWLYWQQYYDIERLMTTIRLRDLAEGDPTRRRLAVEHLSTVDPVSLARVIPAIVAASGDDDWMVRRSAVRSLADVIEKCVGTRNEEMRTEIGLMTAALISAFDDSHAEVRRAAVESVGGLNQLTKFARSPGVPADLVIRAFERDPVAKVRVVAAKVLVRGWPDPVRLYPLMLERYRASTDSEERAAIGWALGRLPLPPSASIPALIDALRSEDQNLRGMVLARLRTSDGGIRSELVEAARRELDAPGGSSLIAAEAIVEMDPKAAEAQTLLGPLVALLRGSSRPFFRQRAAIVLSRYGPAAQPALEALKTMARDDPDLNARLMAVTAVQRIEGR